MANLLYDRMANKVAAGIGIVLSVLWLAIVGGGLYVVWHFVSKFW